MCSVLKIFKTVFQIFFSQKPFYQCMFTIFLQNKVSINDEETFHYFMKGVCLKFYLTDSEAILAISIPGYILVFVPGQVSGQQELPDKTL